MSYQQRRDDLEIERRARARASRKVKKLVDAKLATRDSRPLRIDLDQSTKDLFRKDSDALGIPAYLLYREVLRRFTLETAEFRKEFYIGSIHGIPAGYKSLGEL